MGWKRLTLPVLTCYNINRNKKERQGRTMCIIIAALYGRPIKGYLERSFRSNPEGIGIASSFGGQIAWQKGLTLEETIELAETLPLPYVIHFRLATAGGVSAALCHPFVISNDLNEVLGEQEEGLSDVVLFHNGHIYGWRESIKKTLPKDKLVDLRERKRDKYGVVIGGKLIQSKWDEFMSDSQAAALLTAYEGMGYLRRQVGQKFCVFDSVEGIKMIGRWSYEDGVFYSNDGVFRETWGLYSAGTYNKYIGTGSKESSVLTESKQTSFLPAPKSYNEKTREVLRAYQNNGNHCDPYTEWDDDEIWPANLSSCESRSLYNDYRKDTDPYGDIYDEGGEWIGTDNEDDEFEDLNEVEFIAKQDELESGIIIDPNLMRETLGDVLSVADDIGMKPTDGAIDRLTNFLNAV